MLEPQFLYLWDQIGQLVNRVENVSVQSCRVFSLGLQAQGTCMTPVHYWPVHVLGKMALCDVRGLVCVRHISEPVNHGVRHSLPDWVSTEQVLINTHCLCSREECPKALVLAVAVECQEPSCVSDSNSYFSVFSSGALLKELKGLAM